jgi:hypothetical protein
MPRVQDGGDEPHQTVGEVTARTTGGGTVHMQRVTTGEGGHRISSADNVDDRRVFDALEEAGTLYTRYVELAELSDLSLVAEADADAPNELPIPEYTRPMTVEALFENPA